MTDFSAHFRFPIPDFTQEPWHAELQTAIRAIDTALYQAILIQNVGNWTNSTVYSVGSIVIDSATGLMWTCAVANTSSASPTTFAQERVAHPTFWNATANIPQQRGTWTTATSYIPGDFVVDTNRYAVCLVAHVSGVFNTDLAAGRWVILVDLSNLGVGINATAEGTIASAATTNIGSIPATRINVTGAVNITSFGVVANTYKILRFSAVLTISNSASIILIGGANRVTAAGDLMWVSSDSIGNWREMMFTPATGVPPGVPDATTAVKGIIEIATQGEVDLGTDNNKVVAPDTLATRLAALSATILATIRDGVSGTLDTLAEIATAIGTLAPKANPTFTGTATFDQIAATGNVTGVTPAANDDDTSFATTAFVNDATKWTRQVFDSNGTWTRPTGCKRIFVQIVAPGGGGAGDNVNGAAGANASFDDCVATGGGAGQNGNGGNGSGGIGGTGGANGATFSNITRFSGGDGDNGTGAVDPTSGGNGASSFFGGGGRGGVGGDSFGRVGKAPGSGGGGSGQQVNPDLCSGGGGAGEYVEIVKDNPAASYAAVVPAGGAKGVGSSRSGGDGAPSRVIVWEYYFVP